MFVEIKLDWKVRVLLPRDERGVNSARHQGVTEIRSSPLKKSDGSTDSREAEAHGCEYEQMCC